MPKILLDIPDAVKAQEFLKYFVPHITFVADAQLLPEPNGIEEQNIEEEAFEENNQLAEPSVLYAAKHSYTVEDIQAIANQLPQNHPWTYSDILQYFPKDLKIRVEIIHNQLFIMASPEQVHQEITFELCTLLKTFVKTHQLGKVIISPFDVVLNENNVVVPDMIFVSVAKANILDGKKAQGSPDLLVEVWSLGNKKKERNTKRKLYEENGVLEFWEVFPKKNQVIVQTLNSEGSYEVFSEAQKTGAVRSKILEGFTLDIEALFEEEADISI